MAGEEAKIDSQYQNPLGFGLLESGAAAPRLGERARSPRPSHTAGLSPQTDQKLSVIGMNMRQQGKEKGEAERLGKNEGWQNHFFVGDRRAPRFTATA